MKGQGIQSVATARVSGDFGLEIALNTVQIDRRIGNGTIPGVEYMVVLESEVVCAH